MRFGPDKRLYFSTGDAGNPSLSQDPGSLNGKILRLERQRSTAAAAAGPQVYTLGHRNPQGFDWQPGSNRLISDEHGESRQRRGERAARGRNYGWPDIEGDEARDGLIRRPPSTERRSRPRARRFVKQPGSEWTGDYLIGCLAGEQIRRVGFDGDRVTTQRGAVRGRLRPHAHVVEGPDGALYVLTNNRDGRGSPQRGRRPHPAHRPAGRLSGCAGRADAVFSPACGSTR